MIEIRRVDNNLVVDIEDGPLSSTYSLDFTCGNKWYAELLANHFNKNLEQRITAIRRQEYERGYKDGRSHKPKADWFWGVLKLIGY